MVSLVADISHHLAVVKGWWSAFDQVFHIILLWSRVGGQLLVRYFTPSCCCPGLVVSHHLLSSISGGCHLVVIHEHLV